MVRKISDRNKMTTGRGARRKATTKRVAPPGGAASVAPAKTAAPVKAVAPSPRAQAASKPVVAKPLVDKPLVEASKSVEASDNKLQTADPVVATPAMVEPPTVEPTRVEAIGCAEAAAPQPKETAPPPKTAKELPPSAASGTLAAKLAPATPASEKKELNIMATASTTPPKPEAAAEKVNSMISDLNGRAKAMFERTTKAGEELTEFTKGNMEAFATSAKTAAKGAESLGQEMVDYSKKRFETASETIKNLATVKTPTELFQIQSDYAKSSFDSAIAEASKLSEAWLKLAGDVIQPLSSRYALAADKIKSATL